MVRKVTGLLFKRTRYLTGTSGAGRVYLPSDRVQLMKVLGGATNVYVHARVYDRGASSPSLTFVAAQGSIGDEGPLDGISVIGVTPSAASPTLPWDGTTNMQNVPADGSFTLSVQHAHLDIAASVSGSATTWVEFEAWYTAVYEG